MAQDYVERHRVSFDETDMAGIVHFTQFFKYMERTEHGFVRSLGFSVMMAVEGRHYGWPRLDVGCEYFAPLRFEEEFDVKLRVGEMKEKTIRYEFEFWKDGDEKALAKGFMVVVCVTMGEGGKMRSVAIPEAFGRLVQGGG